MKTKFDQLLEVILEEEFKEDFKAAVAIVQSRDRWLLGLARKTGDDRSGKWVFPGGHMRSGESPQRAAVREAKEETGIQCRAVGTPFALPGKKLVAFVHCTARPGQKLDNNHEFAALGFFTVREMKSLRLYHNVKDLIRKVRG